MKNPLRKRHLRELRTDAGKYIVIFIILVMSISFVSGFLVADGSMIRAYDESFEKYNIEDGKFTAEHRLNRSQKREIEAWGVQLYDLFYHDADLTNGSTLRIFAERTEVDRVCLMEGDMPQSAGEIAVDRMYADNNEIAVGDTVRSRVGHLRAGGTVRLQHDVFRQHRHNVRCDHVRRGGRDGRRFCGHPR